MAKSFKPFQDNNRVIGRGAGNSIKPGTRSQIFSPRGSTARKGSGRKGRR